MCKYNWNVSVVSYNCYMDILMSFQWNNEVYITKRKCPLNDHIFGLSRIPLFNDSTFRDGMLNCVGIVY